MHPCTCSASVQAVEALKAKSLRAWLWALVPAFGLFELGLHVWQVKRALTADDWDEAAVALHDCVRDGEGIRVAPHWAEPVARRALGAMATPERFGASDNSAFSLVWELSLDGASDLPAEWQRDVPLTEPGGGLRLPPHKKFYSYLPFLARQSRLQIHWSVNPHTEPMVTDLLALAERGGEENLTVLRGNSGAETHCVWHTGTPRVEADQEAWGLARGAHYVQCADNAKMSVQVIPDHNWRPRRCFGLPTTGPGARTRLIFHHVHFASIARLHDGLHGYEEDPQNAKAHIKLSLSVQGFAENGKMAELKLGENTHVNGEAWKGFDVDTSAVPGGEVGDLIVDAESDSGDRKFCVEGSTR